MAVRPKFVGARMAVPAATFAMQGKVTRDEDQISSMYMCSRCAIRYEVPRGDKAKCPLCEAVKRLEAVETRAADLVEENRNLKQKLNSLASLTDHVVAIREAMLLVEGEDLVFLKQFMYLYRDDRSYTLSALVNTPRLNARGNRAKNQVRNELILTRGGRDPQRHVFTSIGGVAIVGYFDEMTREVGEKQAMAYLLRSLSLYLSKAE